MSVTLGDLSVVMVGQLQSVFEKRRSVDFDGFRECWESVLGSITSPEMLKLMFDSIDESGDGVVTWDEINHHIRMLHRDEVADAERFITRELFGGTVTLHPFLPKEAHHRDTIVRLFQCPRGELLSFGLDGAVKVWSGSPDYSLQATLHHTSHGGVDCAFDPLSGVAAVCCCDETVSVVSVPSRKVLGHLHLDRMAPVYRTEYRAPANTPPFLFRGKPAPELRGSILERAWTSRHSNLLQRVWAHGRHVDEERSIYVSGAPSCRVTAVGVTMAHGEATIFLGDERGLVSVIEGLCFSRTSNEGVTVSHQWQLHHDAITQITVVGENIISSSKDSDVHVTTADRGVLLRTLRGSKFESTRCHSRGVRGFALTPEPDPPYLVTWGLEMHAVVWDPSVGKQVGSLVCSKPIVSACLDCSGRAFTFSSNRQVRIWDLSSFSCLQQLRESPWECIGPLGALMVHSSGDLIVASQRLCRHAALSKKDAHNASKVWRPISGTHLWTQGNLMLVADEVSVSLWSLEGGFVLSSWTFDSLLWIRGDMDGSAFLCEFSTGELQAMRSSDGKVALILAETHKELGADVQYGAWRGRWVVATRKDLLLFDGTLLEESVVVRSAYERRDLSKLPPCSCLAVFNDTVYLGFMTGDVVAVAGVHIGAYGTLPCFRRRVRCPSDMWWTQVSVPESSGCEWCSVAVGPLQKSPAITVLKAIPRQTMGNVGSERDFEQLDSSRERVSAIVAIKEHLLATSDYSGVVTLWYSSIGEEAFSWLATFAPRSVVTQLAFDEVDTLYYADDIGYLGAFRLSSALLNKTPLQHHLISCEITRTLLRRVSTAAITALTWIPISKTLCIGTACGELLVDNGTVVTSRLQGPTDVGPLDDDMALSVSMRAFRWDFLVKSCPQRRSLAELEEAISEFPSLFPSQDHLREALDQCLNILLVEEDGCYVALLPKRNADVSSKPAAQEEVDLDHGVKQMWEVLDSSAAAYVPSPLLQRPIDISFCSELVSATCHSLVPFEVPVCTLLEYSVEDIVTTSTTQHRLGTPVRSEAATGFQPQFKPPQLQWRNVTPFDQPRPPMRVSIASSPPATALLPRHELFSRRLLSSNEFNEWQGLLKEEFENKILAQFSADLFVWLESFQVSASSHANHLSRQHCVEMESNTRIEMERAAYVEFELIQKESASNRAKIRERLVHDIFELRRLRGPEGPDPLSTASPTRHWTHLLCTSRLTAMIVSDAFSTSAGTSTRQAFQDRCLQLVEMRGTSSMVQRNAYSWDSPTDDIRVVWVNSPVVAEVCGSVQHAVDLAIQHYRSYALLLATCPPFVGAPLCCVVYDGPFMFMCSSSIPQGEASDIQQALVSGGWVSTNLPPSSISINGYSSGQVVVSFSSPCALSTDGIFIRPEALDESRLQDGPLSRLLRRTEGHLLKQLCDTLAKEPTLTGKQLSSFAHLSGVNLRYLGRLLSALQATKSVHQLVVKQEMLARSLKACWRSHIGNGDASAKMTQLLQLLRESLAPHSDQSNAAVFVEGTLNPLLIHKFGCEWPTMSDVAFSAVSARVAELCGLVSTCSGTLKFRVVCRSSLAVARGLGNQISKPKNRRLWECCQRNNLSDSLLTRFVVACHRPKGVSVHGVCSQLISLIDPERFPILFPATQALLIPQAGVGEQQSPLATCSLIRDDSIVEVVLVSGIATELHRKGYLSEAMQWLRRGVACSSFPSLIQFSPCVCYLYSQLEDIHELFNAFREKVLTSMEHARYLVSHPSPASAVRACVRRVVEGLIGCRAEQSALDVLSECAALFVNGQYSEDILEVGFEVRFRVSQQDGFAFLRRCPPSAMRDILLLEASLSSNNKSALEVLCRDAIGVSFATLSPSVKRRYHRGVGCALSVLGQHEAALSALTKALNVSETSQGGVSRSSAADLMCIASCMLRQSKLSQARTTFDVACRLFRQACGELCVEAFTCERWAARCSILQNDLVGGTVTLKRVVEVLQSHVASTTSGTAALHIELSAAHADLGCLLLCATETSMSSHQDIFQQLHVGDGGRLQLELAHRHLSLAVRELEVWQSSTSTLPVLKGIVAMCVTAITEIDGSMDERVHVAQRERVVKTWLRGLQRSSQSSSWMQFLKIAPLM